MTEGNGVPNFGAWARKFLGDKPMTEGNGVPNFGAWARKFLGDKPMTEGNGEEFADEEFADEDVTFHEPVHRPAPPPVPLEAPLSERWTRGRKRGRKRRRAELKRHSRRGKEVRLAIWAPADEGKTALFWAFGTSIFERAMAPRGSDEFSFHTSDGTGKDQSGLKYWHQLEERRSQIGWQKTASAFAEGDTFESGEMLLGEVTWRDSPKGFGGLGLRSVDIPGEAIMDFQEVRGDRGQEDHRYREKAGRILEESDVCLLLISAKKLESDGSKRYSRVFLQQALQNISSRSSSSKADGDGGRPVGIVLTAIDEIGNKELRDSLMSGELSLSERSDLVRDYLNEKTSALVRSAESLNSGVEFFGVSSWGDGKARFVRSGGPGTEARLIIPEADPVHTDEPLVWALRQAFARRISSWRRTKAKRLRGRLAFFPKMVAAASLATLAMLGFIASGANSSDKSAHPSSLHGRAIQLSSNAVSWLRRGVWLHKSQIDRRVRPALIAHAMQMAEAGDLASATQWLREIRSFDSTGWHSGRAALDVSRKWLAVTLAEESSTEEVHNAHDQVLENDDLAALLDGYASSELKKDMLFREIECQEIDWGRIVSLLESDRFLAVNAGDFAWQRLVGRAVEEVDGKRLLPDDAVEASIAVLYALPRASQTRALGPSDFVSDSLQRALRASDGEPSSVLRYLAGLASQLSGEQADIFCRAVAVNLDAYLADGLAEVHALGPIISDGSFLATFPVSVRLLHEAVVSCGDNELIANWLEVLSRMDLSLSEIGYESNDPGDWEIIIIRDASLGGELQGGHAQSYLRALDRSAADALEEGDSERRFEATRDLFARTNVWLNSAAPRWVSEPTRMAAINQIYALIAGGFGEESPVERARYSALMLQLVAGNKAGLDRAATRKVVEYLTRALASPEEFGPASALALEVYEFESLDSSDRASISSAMAEAVEGFGGLWGGKGMVPLSMGELAWLSPDEEVREHGRKFVAQALSSFEASESGGSWADLASWLAETARARPELLELALSDLEEGVVSQISEEVMLLDSTEIRHSLAWVTLQGGARGDVIAGRVADQIIVGAAGKGTDGDAGALNIEGLTSSWRAFHGFVSHEARVPPVFQDSVRLIAMHVLQEALSSLSRAGELDGEPQLVLDAFAEIAASAGIPSVEALYAGSSEGASERRLALNALYVSAVAEALVSGEEAEMGEAILRWGATEIISGIRPEVIWSAVYKRSEDQYVLALRSIMSPISSLGPDSSTWLTGALIAGVENGRFVFDAGPSDFLPDGVFHSTIVPALELIAKGQGQYPVALEEQLYQWIEESGDFDLVGAALDERAPPPLSMPAELGRGDFLNKLSEFPWSGFDSLALIESHVAGIRKHYSAGIAYEVASQLGYPASVCDSALGAWIVEDLLPESTANALQQVPKFADADLRLKWGELLGRAKGMVFIPQGRFFISRHEVSREDYLDLRKKVVLRGGSLRAPALSNASLSGSGMPIQKIAHSDAEQYCRIRGTLLPTGAQMVAALEHLQGVGLHGASGRAPMSPLGKIVRARDLSPAASIASNVREYLRDSGEMTVRVFGYSHLADRPEGSGAAPPRGSQFFEEIRLSSSRQIPYIGFREVIEIPQALL